jgi:hypothetical protein
MRVQVPSLAPNLGVKMKYSTCIHVGCGKEAVVIRNNDLEGNDELVLICESCKQMFRIKNYEETEGDKKLRG